VRRVLGFVALSVIGSRSVSRLRRKGRVRLWIEQRAMGAHPLGGRKKIFTMIQAYMDDSGTHAKAPICTLGGYFGGVGRWKEFERRWQSVLDRYHVKDFHAKRFWAKTPTGERVDDYKGWSDEKADLFLKELLKTIERSTIYPFVSGVVAEEWKKIELAQRRLFTGATRSHPTGAPTRSIFLAFIGCIFRITSYCKPGITVEIVVDQDRRNEKWAHLCIRGLKDEIPELGRQIGDLTFADRKKARPLQAADLIAYEANLYARIANGDANAPMRPSYRAALVRARSVEDFQLWDKARFETFFSDASRYLSRPDELRKRPVP